MPTLEPKSVNMVFADLPYQITQNKWDVAVDPVLFWQAVTPVCPFVILTATLPFASMMIAANKKRYRYDLIWHKPNRGTGFLNAKRMPLRAHEHCLVFYAVAPPYNPIFSIGSDIDVAPSKQKSKNYGGHQTTKSYKSLGKRYPTSVISVPCRNDERKHPTQKPVALLEWLIATYTNPGDTVLDPVFGSNTTGLACARLGRNYVGIEKDPEYFRIGTERVNAERAKLGLDSAVVMT